MNRKLIAALQKVIARIATPDPLVDYIRGTGSPVSGSDLPENYIEEIQNAIPQKPITIYRAFDWPIKLEKEYIKANHRDNPFTGDIPLISFTASKDTAISIAKSKYDDYDDDVYVYVISMKAYPEDIYFHYMFNDIGREHPHEKEILIDASGKGFEIVEEYAPRGML